MGFSGRKRMIRLHRRCNAVERGRRNVDCIFTGSSGENSGAGRMAMAHLVG